MPGVTATSSLSSKYTNHRADSHSDKFKSADEVYEVTGDCLKSNL